MKTRVLELGAGTGMLGIQLAVAGAHVTITDKKQCLDLMQWNVQVNCTPEQQSHVIVQELLWGESKPSQFTMHPFDIVIFSDCIYSNKEIWEKLSFTLLDFVSTSCELIFAYEVRNTKDLAFFPFMQQVGFVFNEVPSSDLDEQFQSDDIVLFHGKNTKNL